MGIGAKIKEFRTREGLTQKQLADELCVTYQAVSRWENDDTEPSFDTLKDMCRILNCSTDELFGIEKNDINNKDDAQGAPTEIYSKQQPVLAVCEHCNKPIYDSDDLNRIENSKRVWSGRSSHVETTKTVLCNTCNEQRLLEEKQEKQRQETYRLEGLKKRRIHSLIWPSLIFVALLTTGIVGFAIGDTNLGIGGVVCSVLGFTFTATMILNNTFITDMWEEIASWGFVRLPGIIFEFSFDGLVFLIAMKILFFVLGMSLAVLAFIFATAIAALLSLFVYPFAIIKNVKGIE